VTTAPLHERIHAYMRSLTERTDVIIARQAMYTSPARGRWAKVLPPDMFAFYSRINGLIFYWHFVDDPQSLHGFNLLRLEKGNKVIDPGAWRYVNPHQPVKKYPKGFFHEEARLDAEEEVLLFEGDDGAHGHIMVGTGEAARFYHWDSDGFVSALGGGFTELLERGLLRGFANTWALEGHADTAKVVARLATAVEKRTLWAWSPESKRINVASSSG
jgi:hypothetical protein